MKTIRYFIALFWTFGTAVVAAQTAQLVITAPASLAGNFAAVTYSVAPSAFTTLNVVPQGEAFIYDSVNCAARTFTKPISGSAAGKVAVVMDSHISCTFDDIVRAVHSDGAVAVVVTNPVKPLVGPIVHADATGLQIPLLYLQSYGAAAAIRASVLAGAPVQLAFAAIPLAAGRVTVIPVSSGTQRQLLVSMIPTSARFVDYASVDLLPTSLAQNDSVIFTSQGCNAVRVAYSAQTHLMTVDIPATITGSDRCELAYLIRDSAGLQVASRLDLLLNFPRTIVDIAGTPLNTSIEIDVLANDIGSAAAKSAAVIDLGTETTTLAQTFTNSAGTWKVTADRKVSFTPTNGFSGLAVGRYRLVATSGNVSNTVPIEVMVGGTFSYQGQGKTAREFYLPERDVYFLTADAEEGNVVANGGAGPWIETGNAFPVGGTTQVCRFYGNTNRNSATNAVYGPQSHFYTIDAAECNGLKSSYDPRGKSWHFESNDFWAIPTNADRTCPAFTTPIFRMYNNGFPNKDSNHRYSPIASDLTPMLALGWVYEGPAFCLPGL